MEVVVEGKNSRILCVSLFTRCSSQGEAVTRQEMTSHDVRWPEVTRKWRHFPGSHLEVAVEGQKLAYTLSFTPTRL